MRIRKILDELKKGTILGLLLTSFYGVGTYIYKNQNKSESKIEIKNNKKKDNI